MPAPKEALAPAWKFVPVTVTVRLAPGAPELGDRLEIVGTIGKLTVALAEVPSAKVAVTEKLEPGAKTVLNSAANRKKTLPSATAKLTVPLPALRRAPSALKAAEAFPTLSRSLPRKARLMVAGGGATVNPPGLTPDWPLGFETVTSRGPIVAVAPIARATES